MMECKKALVETEGDIQKAEELLRIKSGAKASGLPVVPLLKVRLPSSLPLMAKSARWLK